ncbi:hypothetical protein KDL28_12440 [Pseudonocardia sp. S2-4]|uniref:Uncharacterized protein n=1 Tax=Pseudonocardia humida TaxID=2800819 RepID=A0ABT0ZYN9_9PSEU|nr:hypothetical protein [Pseudonocardia humida]
MRRTTTGGFVVTSAFSISGVAVGEATSVAEGRGGSTGRLNDDAGREGASTPRRDADQADVAPSTIPATTANTAHGASLVRKLLLDRLGEGRVDRSVTAGTIVVGTSPDDGESYRRTTWECLTHG